MLRGDVRSFALPEHQLISSSTAHCVIVWHRRSYARCVTTFADPASRPMALMRTIIDGTEHVVQLAERSGAKRFLFMSSGAVYSRQPENRTGLTQK